MREPKPELKPPVNTQLTPDRKINLKDAFCQSFVFKEGENNIFYNGNNFIILAGNRVIVNSLTKPDDEVVDTISTDEFEIISFVDDENVINALKNLVEKTIKEQNSQNTNRVSFVPKNWYTGFESHEITEDDNIKHWVKLDSIKLAVDVDCVKKFDSSCFMKVTYDNGSKYEKLIFFGDEGLKYVEIKPDEAIIEASAKILGDNYIKGLRVGTVYEFFEKLNEIGVINVDVDEAIENGRVLRCDVTDNVVVSSKRKYLRALSFVDNPRYIKEVYNRGVLSGVVFRRHVKTYKERIIVYDKAKELKSNPKWFEDFANILRVEQNITSLERIRKVFGTEDNRLIYILLSSSHPNFFLLKKIVEGAKPRDEVENMNGREFKDFCFLSYLKEHYSLEETRRLLLEKFCKNTAYRYMKQLKTLRDVKTMKTLNEFLNLLRRC